MRRNSVSLLRCITCENTSLKALSFESDKVQIIEGKILCEKCKSGWPIIGGIPRIFKQNLLEELVIKRHPDFFKKYSKEFKFKVKKNSLKESAKLKTAASFGYEWNKYSKILDIFEKDWRRYFNPFVTKNSIKNKVVVDFGCGLAKHGYFTSKYGAKYIGIDLSDAVEDAYKNTKEFNSLIIQADIYNIPVNGAKVDLFYSIGVIHHLPNPKEGFLEIAKLMKKKSSKILIWVYGKKGNKRALYFYNPLRIITVKIPKTLMYYLCHVPALAVQSLNLTSNGLEKIGLKKIAKKVPFYYYANFPYSFKHNDSFDVLATPTQEYYSKEEIANWFEDAKIKNFKLVYDKYQGIKGFGSNEEL